MKIVVLIIVAGMGGLGVHYLFNDILGSPIWVTLGIAAVCGMALSWVASDVQ